MSYTKYIANGMLCVSLFFLGSTAVLAENKGDVQQVPIEIKGNIVGQTCKLVSNSPDNIMVDIGEIDINRINDSSSGIDIKLKDIAENITIECSHGSRATFSMAAAGPKCEQDKTYLCGGKNKSVGMSVSYVYLDNKTGERTILSRTKLDQKLELRLTNAKGSIEFYEALLRKLKGVDVSTGEISASYVLTIYSQ